jgi:phosphohistidine phosphatase
MNIYLIRHGKAGDQAIWKQQTGQDDQFRPLTQEGLKVVGKMAQQLKRLNLSISSIQSSPYTRARETAEIIHHYYPDVPLLFSPQLQPDADIYQAVSCIGRYIENNPGDLAIVGHEPHLSRLISVFISGDTRVRLQLKKGSISCVEFDGAIGPDQGTLKWVIPPKLWLMKSQLTNTQR